MTPVFGAIGALIAGYFTFEWLRAGRAKRATSRRAEVPPAWAKDPADAVIDGKNDANVSWSHLGSGASQRRAPSAGI